MSGADALLVEVARVGVPEVRAGADVVCGDADDLADGALIQELAHGLEFGGQEGVGRGTHKEALRSGKLDDLIRLLQARGQGLFAVDMLAGLQGSHGQAVVGGGVGENDDDVHLGIRQHFLRRVDLGDVPARGGGLGGLHVQVRAAHGAQVFEHGAEGAEVVVAVDTGADDAIAKNFFFHECALLFDLFVLRDVFD